MRTMSTATANGKNKRRGAAVLLEVLRSEGARYVFGNPGTTELPLIDALVDAPDIRYILALQEASAVALGISDTAKGRFTSDRRPQECCYDGRRNSRDVLWGQW